MFIRNSCCVFVDMKICTAILLSLCCLVYTVKTEDPWQFWNNFIAQQVRLSHGFIVNVDIECIKKLERKGLR